MRIRQVSSSVLLQGTLVILALVVPLFAGPYWVHVGTLAWYYAILAASWALLAGFAGQFSFAHLAFAALGGYTSALIVLHTGMPLVVGIVTGMVLAAVIGALIGWLVLRLSGPYLALFTLAIAEIFHLILVAEEELTRGSLGLAVPSMFTTDSDTPYYYMGLGLVLLSVASMTWLLRTRVGLFLRTIREDEGAAAASGVNTTFYKILVFVFTSAVAGLAGAFYGHFIGILTPTMVILPQMGLVIAMAVIGGIESLPGAVVGAVVVYMLSEMLREYGQMRFVLLGLALILVQRFAQNGLFPLLEQGLDRVFRRTRSPQTVSAVEGDAAPAGEKHVD